MAFTIRGSANVLNKVSKVENKNGFQEVSAPGPRQGVGGQSVSLLEAQKGRVGELQDTEKKCTPITEKASPLKINETLVQGAADSAKKFVDAGEAFGKGMDNSTIKQKK